MSETRPWGNWRIIEETEHYKIKAITINPGQRLSLQFHKYRKEHWIVAKGTALVTKDTIELLLHPGEYVEIPSHAPHRAANKSNEPLIIIEVQYGTCNEDDIIRIEDDYGRAQ